MARPAVIEARKAQAMEEMNAKLDAILKHLGIAFGEAEPEAPAPEPVIEAETPVEPEPEKSRKRK